MIRSIFESELQYCSFAKKTSDLLEKFVVLMYWKLFTVFSHIYAQEQIAPFPNSSVALGKEQVAIPLFRSQKTSDSHEKPKIEFPTLHYSIVHCNFKTVFSKI